MLSDSNFREKGADIKPFLEDAEAKFDPSVYSKVLNQRLVDIRTHVVPNRERPAQSEAFARSLSPSPPLSRSTITQSGGGFATPPHTIESPRLYCSKVT